MDLPHSLAHISGASLRRQQFQEREVTLLFLLESHSQLRMLRTAGVHCPWSCLFWCFQISHSGRPVGLFPCSVGTCTVAHVYAVRRCPTAVRRCPTILWLFICCLRFYYSLCPCLGLSPSVCVCVRARAHVCRRVWCMSECADVYVSGECMVVRRQLSGVCSPSVLMSGLAQECFTHWAILPDYVFLSLMILVIVSFSVAVIKYSDSAAYRREGSF